MSAEDYRRKLRDPRWRSKRDRILERDGRSCRNCGDRASRLHVHHMRYREGAEPWDVPDEWLITLCQECHSVTEEAIKGIVSLCRGKLMAAASILLESVASQVSISEQPMALLSRIERFTRAQIQRRPLEGARTFLRWLRSQGTPPFLASDGCVYLREHGEFRRLERWEIEIAGILEDEQRAWFASWGPERGATVAQDRGDADGAEEMYECRELERISSLADEVDGASLERGTP